MLCLAAACKKDNQNKKIHLISQQIIDDRADGAPIDTTNYVYDDQNHLTLIRSGTPGNPSYSMSYDVAGRVEAGKKLNSDGSIAKEYDFFYTPSVGFILKVPSKKNDTAFFTFNAKKQVTLIQTIHGGYSTYTYDDQGNISALKNYEADGSNDLTNETFYTYDSQKNYFSQIPPNNYFLMYLLYPDADALINNIITKNADTYTYTYDSDGFPIKATAKIVGHALTPIYYNYIVK